MSDKSDPNQVTFRDFAGALMAGDDHKAAEVLEALLGIGRPQASGCAAAFRKQMAESPAFMQKAMSMRHVVEGGDQQELATLIAECFALDAETAQRAAESVLERYR